MKRVIIASTTSGIDENAIDTLLAGHPRWVESPNRYLYAICVNMGSEPPRFIDPAAGGVRLRFTCRDEETANQVLDEILTSADELGIPVYRPTVKPAVRGRYYAYSVVPRYNG